MYPQAASLGISYEAFWELEPIEIFKVAEVKEKEFMDRTNYELSLHWYSASLNGIAMNDPKKFPKKPPKIESNQDKVEKAKILAYKLEAMMRSGDFSGKKV